MKSRQEKQEERDRKQALSQVNAQITSKLGYIRYLRARAVDPEPVYAEIRRHNAAITTHQDAIDRLEATLLNLDGCIEAAQAELSQLHRKHNSLVKHTGAAKEIQAKLDRLQEKLNVLLGGAG